MKKSILGLGSAAAIIAPIVGVVACGSDSSDEKEEKSLKEILTSKVIVLSTVDAAKADGTLLSAIKAQIESDFGLELKKADILTITTNTSGGATHAAIDVTTDATAKEFYVTVKRNDEEVANAKNIKIKVRKETIGEKNQREFDAASKLIEKYSELDSPLDLDISEINNVTGLTGISATAYTNNELSAWIANGLVTVTSGIVRESDGSGSGSANIVIKKINDQASQSSGDNTVDLTTTKKVEIELKFGSGNDEVKKDLILYVKSKA